MQNSIVFSHVKKAYGKTVVIEDLNLEIREGERLILLGPSGCGKTTTLRMIAGFEEISGGELYMNGKVVNDLPPGERNIAMVFQSYALFPHLSVWDNITFGLQLQKLPEDEIRARAEKALEILHLKGYEHKKTHELSGGQKQRVALCRAIVKHSPYFLLDEPLSNLDAQLRLRARKELVKIHEMYHQTLIYVTHDQSEALAMADRILIMKNGKIEQVGTPEEIYLHPQTEFAASFVSKCNFVRGQWNDSYFKVMDQSLIYDGPEVAQAFKNHGLFPVRPEQFHIVKEGKGIPATVTNRQYSGREIHYSLKCGEDTFTVYAGSREQYEPGEQVKLVYQAS